MSEKNNDKDEKKVAEESVEIFEAADEVDASIEESEEIFDAEDSKFNDTVEIGESAEFDEMTEIDETAEVEESTEFGEAAEIDEPTELDELAEPDKEELGESLGAVGAAGVAAGLIEKNGAKGKTKKKNALKENKYVKIFVDNVKGFSFRGFAKGMRGKITLLAVIVAIVPMIILSTLNIFSQAKVITNNVEQLNTAVNKGLIERVDATVATLIKTMQLVPDTSDLMALQPSDQERVLRKIASSDNTSFREVILTNQNGFALAATNSKLVGENLAGNLWYVQAMKGTTFISNIYPDLTSKLPVFNIAVPVLDASRNPVGVLYAKVALDKIQKLIKETKVGENGIAYIVDTKGVVLAHPDFSKMVMKGYNVINNKIEGAALVAKGKTGQSTYKNSENVQVQGTYYTIPSTSWGLVTEIGLDEAMKPVASARNFSIILVLVVGILALIASVYMALLIAAPLVQMVGIADEIKKGRFNNKIKVKGQDEIAKLQESFNEMSESLSNLLRQVDVATQNITNASVKMTDSTHTASAAVEEITAIVEDVANGAVDQIASVEEAVRVVNEISNSVESAANKTSEVSSRAAEAAIIAQQGSENIQTISEKVNGIKENVISNSELVGKLGEKSARVGETVKAIREIAGKTNMLALNAAIEAARAGDAGRGFAVVANEIRNLAEQTRDASKSIESLLKEIQIDSLTTVESMKIGITEVEAGTVAIANTYGTFNKIIEDVQLVAKDVMEVSSTVLTLQQESTKVVDAVKRVESIAQATSSGTQNVLASTEEQASSTQEMATLSTELSQMAEELKTMISKFEFERTCISTEKEV